ncbi:MAG: hypothetical protein WD077_07845 [Bacteroidia bacterium]
MEPGLEIQNTLFSLIKMGLPKHFSLVDEVADYLNVSNDSAYRRIRGEKQLSISELAILCKVYKVSFDSLLSIDNQSVVLHGRPLQADKLTFEHYLGTMLAQLGQIRQAEERQIIYYAKDIPVFHFYNFHNLAAFKFYFWMRIILEVPDYQEKKFKANIIDDKLIETANEIIRVYTQISSVEIWTPEIANSTLWQLRYCEEMALFESQQDLDTLYTELQGLIAHVELQAAAGVKFLPGQTAANGAATLELYNNSMLMGDNAIFTITDGKMTYYLIHGVINYLATINEAFCRYSHASLKNICKRSSLISSVNERERTQFFRKLREKVVVNK